MPRSLMLAVLILAIALPTSELAAEDSSAWRVPFDRGLSRTLNDAERLLRSDRESALALLKSIPRPEEFRLVQVGEGRFVLAQTRMRELFDAADAEFELVAGFLTRDAATAPLSESDRSDLVRRSLLGTRKVRSVALESLAEDGWLRGEADTAIRYRKERLDSIPATGSDEKPVEAAMAAARWVLALHLAGYEPLAAQAFGSMPPRLRSETITLGGEPGPAERVLETLLRLPPRMPPRFEWDPTAATSLRFEPIIATNTRPAIAAAAGSLLHSTGPVIHETKIDTGSTVTLYPPPIASSFAEGSGETDRPILVAHGDRLFAIVDASAESDPSVDPFAESPQVMVALDLSRQGDVLWRRGSSSNPGRWIAAAAVGGSVVTLREGDRGELTASGWDAATGRERWESPLGLPVGGASDDGNPGVPIVDRGGLLLVFPDPKTVLCLDPILGVIRWAHTFSGRVIGPLTRTGAAHPWQIELVDRRNAEIVGLDLLDGMHFRDANVDLPKRLLPTGLGVSMTNRSIWPVPGGLAVREWAPDGEWAAPRFIPVAQMPDGEVALTTGDGRLFAAFSGGFSLIVPDSAP